MYGLKQASKVWYTAIDDYLSEECGFVKSEAALNLFILSLLFLILYVDDILIFSQSLGKAHGIRDKLSLKYKMSDLGPVQHFLGLQISRNMDERTVFINQAK